MVSYAAFNIFSIISWQQLTYQPFPEQALVFTCLQHKSFENTVEKGEIACNKQFLLFPVFSTFFKNFLQFSSNLKLSVANSFSSEESKIGCLGKVNRFPWFHQNKTRALQCLAKGHSCKRPC